MGLIDRLRNRIPSDLVSVLSVETETTYVKKYGREGDDHAPLDYILPFHTKILP